MERVMEAVVPGGLPKAAWGGRCIARQFILTLYVYPFLAKVREGGWVGDCYCMAHCMDGRVFVPRSRWFHFITCRLGETNLGGFSQHGVGGWTACVR